MFYIFWFIFQLLLLRWFVKLIVSIVRSFSPRQQEGDSCTQSNRDGNGSGYGRSERRADHSSWEDFFGSFTENGTGSGNTGSYNRGNYGSTGSGNTGGYNRGNYGSTGSGNTGSYNRSYTGRGGYGNSGGYGYSGGHYGNAGGVFGTASALSKAYRTLGVDSSASDSEIKSAYKKLALKYHPDRYANSDSKVQKGAEEQFKKINEAYQVVKKNRGLD